MHRAVSTAKQDCHLEEMAAFGSSLAFQRISAASSESRYSAITLFSHPSCVINLINLDSSDKDTNDDDKSVTGQKGDPSMKLHW